MILYDGACIDDADMMQSCTPTLDDDDDTMIP